MRVVAVALVLSALPAAAENWPSFRGPNAAGIADGLSLATRWDGVRSENVEWKTKLEGLGHSSPIVWGDRIFVTSAVSGDPDSIFVHGLDGRIDRRSDRSEHRFVVYSLRASTGEVLWEREASRAIPKIQRHPKNSYASPTPVTDGKHVIAYFGSEGLYAFDFDGNLLWKRDLGTIDAGASYDDTYDWGVGSSPALYRGMVFVIADSQAGSFLAAFDAATGEPVWRVERQVISSFSTPLIHEGEKRVELVTNGAEVMHGYDPLTGRELWHLAGSSKNTTPTPIAARGLFFITSGYRMNPIFAVRPGGTGDITETDFVAWKSSRDGSYMTTPIVYGDLLYTCQNNGVLAAYRAESGVRVYQERIATGAFSASPIASDGRLYFTSEDGDVYVVAAGEEFELLATNPMGEVLMATPAAAPGRLFIRGQHHLFSIKDAATADERESPRPR
ncbi:MAG TPA: PQQ-binding-like beta-propeller repeat protein [Vicinamibacteria bacterium]|nr:PQQ-binding-like beta-propeller repeat protein [Vicinamibacteria bacterium]